MKLRIATRRSRLALAQSGWVRDRLLERHPGLEVELREYVTRGDRVQHVPLAGVGGKGIFTREIEDALLAGDADVAVHSLKDLPSEQPPGLILGAIPAREDPRDVIVRPIDTPAPAEDVPLDALPPGARIGSSSLRRLAQLRHARPDLELRDIRGNVDTRLRKLDGGDYEALILAAAGLRRLGLEARITAALPPEVCLPAPGQGALALQCREEDEAARALLATLDHAATRAAVTAERALMTELGGGCSIPLGALGEAADGVLRLRAVVADPAGEQLLREAGQASPEEAEALGRRVAAALRALGAAALLKPQG